MKSGTQAVGGREGYTIVPRGEKTAWVVPAPRQPAHGSTPTRARKGSERELPPPPARPSRTHARTHARPNRRARPPPVRDRLCPAPKRAKL